MIPIIYSSSNSSNPTYSSFYKYLERFSDPELLLLDVSYRGISEIFNACLNASLIVVDNFVHVASRLNPSTFSSVTLSQWRGVDFYNEVWEIATNGNCPVLYIASGWDLHWPGPDLDALLSRIHGIAWVFERQPIDVSTVPLEYKDYWMKQSVDPLLNWKKVVDNIAIRIEMSHHISSCELAPSSYRPLWQVCVPGVSYRTRIEARRSAKRQMLNVAPYSTADSIILRVTDIARYFLGNVNASIARNQIRQRNQRFFTSRSLVNFVCGSGYRYPVRKFFEIPASRSAMITYPFEGMADFGFIDGVNCIFTDPINFGEEARYLLNNDRLRDSLINSSFHLISSLHMAEKRVSDHIKCIKLMASGRLKNARFSDGEFVINSI